MDIKRNNIFVCYQLILLWNQNSKHSIDIVSKNTTLKKYEYLEDGSIRMLSKFEK